MLELIADNLLARILLLLIIFLAVTFGVLALSATLSRRKLKQERLEEIGSTATANVMGGTLRSQANDGAWARLAKAVESAGLDLTDTKQQRLSAWLREAGFPSPAAPRVFTLVRLLMVFAMPLLYLALDYSIGDPPGFFRAYIVCAILAIVGLYLPNLYVQVRLGRRRDEIRNGFPDCLELLIVCVESGLGIEAALDRVGREMVRSHPLIAELLSITTLQLRAGASRESAFRKLGQVAGIDEIRSFTTLLIQSDKLGTSITVSLRVYAAEMRERRRLRAEEKAHRLPVLISVPLVVCMLPTMVGVLMLPAAIRMVRDVIPALAGGG